MSPPWAPTGTGARGPCQRRRRFPSGSRAFWAASLPDTPLPGSSRALPPAPSALKSRRCRSQWRLRTPARPLGLLGSNLPVWDCRSSMCGGPGGEGGREPGRWGPGGAPAVARNRYPPPSLPARHRRERRARGAAPPGPWIPSRTLTGNQRGGEVPARGQPRSGCKKGFGRGDLALIGQLSGGGLSPWPPEYPRRLSSAPSEPLRR